MAVSCPACPLRNVQGVKVKTAEKNDHSRIATADTEELYELLAEAFYTSRGVRISVPSSNWLSSQRRAAEATQQPDAPAGESAELAGAVPVPRDQTARPNPVDWREPREVQQIYLGTRYLRLVEARTMRPVLDVVPLLCSSCERTLTYTDQLLCTKRRWGFGRSVPESACYVNSLVTSNVVVKPSYPEHLAQGLMEMADVYCCCGVQVGYKFVADKTATGRNQNQVGRFGLVCSRFNLATYQLSHSKLHIAGLEEPTSPSTRSSEIRNQSHPAR